MFTLYWIDRWAISVLCSRHLPSPSIRFQYLKEEIALVAYPTDLSRTKDWATEVLTDADLEGQLDLIINWIDAFADETSGHKHDATLNEGPKILVSNWNLASAAAEDILFHDGTNLVRLEKGTAAQTLKMNAGATAPEWVT